jgi:hypothetical protein
MLISAQKRLINFITHDLGGVIAKDVRINHSPSGQSGLGYPSTSSPSKLLIFVPQALVAAALEPGSWFNILDMSRVLVSSTTLQARLVAVFC